jgi:hypothetical protein
MPRYAQVLVACARWETACIAEWIAYHRHLGFDHLYLYCNDDDPAELYEAVLPFMSGPHPYVTFHFHRPLGEQKQMYLHYLKNYKADTEWFMFLDIDEFLRLPRHRTIAEFLAEHGPAADGIYFNWSSFGNNFHHERPAGSVLLNYTRRAASIYNGSAKVITRAAAIALDRLALGPRSDFWHYWDSLENFYSLRLQNVLGEPVYDYCDNPAKWDAYLHRPEIHERLRNTGIIHHYAYKSLRDFQRRTARGTAGDFAGQATAAQHYDNGQGAALMALMNEVEDRSLHDLWSNLLAGGRRATVIA